LAWEFRIIDDDTVVNAFAAPGGYVWIYTGLIQTLDNEDSFAGVIAHEVGHADGRHSTEALTRVYGLGLLLDVVLGNDGASALAGDLAEGLAGLEFSRANERDADNRSVAYLCDTPYAADSVAMFFEALGESNGPTFLSTHPAPANRVQDVRQLAQDEDCSTERSGLTDFQALRDSLP
jgi:predicted Zn-dependent protease